MAKDFTIRKMCMEDIPSVVAIHRRAFRGYFLEQMGARFLKTYYELTLLYRQPIALVYEEVDLSVKGFAVGFINPKAFYGYFKKSRLKLFLPTILGLLMNPQLISKVFQNMRRIFISGSSANLILAGDEFAELSSIATSKNSSGVGSALLAQFLQDAWSRDVSCVTLTTDLDNNEKAHKFYKKFGFIEDGIVSRQGRNLSHYVLVHGEI
jgi:ribosomal protein S18 acetylase RimI-like enzyme